MNIIIDTHVFLWLLNEPSRLNSEHMAYIENTDNNIFLSSMSVAELMIKRSIGKLDFEFDILTMTEEMGAEVLDFNGFDAIKLGTLPLHHKDPFDRMIISQALSNEFNIISYDNKFNLYDCKLM